MFRWASIKNDKKMRVDLQKYFRSDEKKSAGYLFFTDDIEDATAYGIATSLIDMNALVDPIMRQVARQGRDIVVVALKTSGVRQRVEVDPEVLNHQKHFGELAKTRPRAEQFAKSTWYRIKGDLDIKHTFGYKISPFDQLPDFVVQTILEGIVITDLREIAIAEGVDLTT